MFPVSTVMLERRCAGSLGQGNKHDGLDQSTRALSRCAERRALHPSGIGLRSDLGAHRRGPRIRGRHVRRLGRLARRCSARPTWSCSRSPSLPSRPTASTAPASLPLLVDADHGYGNALSVKRTVEELETAGVAGLTIEDTVLPTPYGATETRLHSDRGGRRQDACRARRPAGPSPRDRRPYQRAPDHGRRRTPSRGSRPTRPPASTCCSWPASSRAPSSTQSPRR